MLPALVLALVSIVAQFQFQRLGSPDYWVRESAEDCLRWLDCLAWPTLRACRSENPEIEYRRARLLKAFRARMSREEARRILLGGAFDLPRIRASPDLRWDMCHLAIELGCTREQSYYLDPDRDWLDEAWWGPPGLSGFEADLWLCRQQIRRNRQSPALPGPPAK